MNDILFLNKTVYAFELFISSLYSMKKLLIFLLIIFPLAANSAHALEHFATLSTPDLVKLLEYRSKGKVDFLLVNALDEIIYRDGHIPGSINLPLSRVQTLIKRLGTDYDRLIIPYCMGHR